jgi:hypothetical protein
MPTLADIENAVTAQNTVIDSVAVLLNHLTDQIAEANRSGDSDTIARIIVEIQDGTARLTTAVTANTPGGPAVVTPLPVAAAPVPVVFPLPVEAVQGASGEGVAMMSASHPDTGDGLPINEELDPSSITLAVPNADVSRDPPVVDNTVDATVPPPAE